MNMDVSLPPAFSVYIVWLTMNRTEVDPPVEAPIGNVATNFALKETPLIATLRRSQVGAIASTIATIYGGKPAVFEGQLGEGSCLF